MAPIFTGVARGFGGFGFGKSSSQTTFITASGGTISTPGNGFRYHTFTHPGTPSTNPYSDSFVISSGTSVVDVLIVAAGGGGGSGYYGGGGGAGAVIHGQSVTVAPGTYPITIGNGGAGGLYPPGPSSGANGGNSAFDTVTSLGGGRGGSGPAGPGGDIAGGSGGNAGGGSAYAPAGTSTPMTIPSPYSSLGTWNIYQYPRPSAGPIYSGGDGAGGSGGNYPVLGGNATGGVGVAIPTFSGPLIPTLAPVVPKMGPNSSYYGGGGAGGYAPGTYPAVAGGFGGGGDSGNGDVPNSPDYLGGGGGGSGNPRGNGGRGGNGVVIIRYAV